jgi:hypothetical protein
MPILDDEEFKRRLYQLAVARSDLTEAITTVRFMIDNIRGMNHELWIPLQDAMVVSYARPFTGNRP